MTLFKQIHRKVIRMMIDYKLNKMIIMSCKKILKRKLWNCIILNMNMLLIKIPLEKINSKLFDCQKDIPHIQRVVVAFEVLQECTKIFSAMDDTKDKHMASTPLENDIHFNEMEQQPTYKNE